MFALDSFTMQMNSQPGLSMGCYRNIFKKVNVASKFDADGNVLQLPRS